MAKTTSTTSTKAPFAYIGGKLGDRLQISRDGGTTWAQQALITNSDDAGLALDMCRTSKPAKQYRIVGPAGDDGVKVHPTLPEVTPAPAGDEVDLTAAVAAMAKLDHSAEFIKPEPKPATQEEANMVTPKPKKTPAAKPTPTAEKPAKGGKKTPAATPVATKPAKGGKKTAAEKPTPAATKPTPAAEKSAQYGIERSKDLPWSQKKVALFKALKALKAISEGSAVTAAKIVEKDGSLTPRDVRHYAYHAKAGGLIELATQEGVHGYVFYLTPAGVAIDPAKELAAGK